MLKEVEMDQFFSVGKNYKIVKPNPNNFNKFLKNVKMKFKTKSFVVVVFFV